MTTVLVTVLVHRYDNEPDINAISKNGCSDVYRRATNDDFEYVLVIPTGKAKTSKAVLYKRKSGQCKIVENLKWPGRPDKYGWRTEIIPESEVITTLEDVKKEFKRINLNFAGPWTVRAIQMDIRNL